MKDYHQMEEEIIHSKVDGQNESANFMTKKEEQDYNSLIKEEMNKATIDSTIICDSTILSSNLSKSAAFDKTKINRGSPSHLLSMKFRIIEKGPNYNVESRNLSEVKGFENAFMPKEYFPETCKAKRIYDPKGTFPNKENKENAKKNYDKYLNKLGSLRGPGEYTEKDKIITQDFEASFGSKEPRFVKKSFEKDTNPGVGDYSHRENWININKNLKPSAVPSDRNSWYIKEATPGVGSYSPGIISSINYKNVYGSKRCLPDNFTNIEGHKPNILEYQNKGTGPGSYNLRKYDEYSPDSLSNKFHRSVDAQNYSPFNTSDPRFKYDRKQNVGPGKYEMDSKFDWNTKSYNKLFI